MRRFQTLALLVRGCLTTAAIAAADVQLSMRDGRVSIVAKDATVAEILAEWARVGQTTVVNADTLARERVTIELKNVTEDQALAVLLRKASGYLAVPRAADLPDASRFDRILLMRATVAPAPAPPVLKAAAPPDPAAC